MQFLAGWPWGVFETTGWECWRHPLFFHGRIIVAAMIAAVFHFMSEKERRIWASNPFPSCFSLQTLSGYWFNFNLFECFICKKPFQKFSWFWVWKTSQISQALHVSRLGARISRWPSAKWSQSMNMINLGLVKQFLLLSFKCTLR